MFTHAAGETVTVLARDAADVLRICGAFIHTIDVTGTECLSYDGTNREVLGEHGRTTSGCNLEQPKHGSGKNWFANQTLILFC